MLSANFLGLQLVLLTTLGALLPPKIWITEITIIIALFMILKHKSRKNWKAKVQTEYHDYPLTC